MTTQHPLTKVLIALLNIQNNLRYIEKELEALQLNEDEKESIKQVTSPYYFALFDCQEELASLNQEHTVFTVDPFINELTDNKTDIERAIVIINTLHKHNKLITQCTDGIIAKHDTIAEDTEFALLRVLMTESVGNILHLSHYVTGTLTTLTNNN